MRKLAKKKTKRNEAETDMKTGKSNECYSSGEEGHRQGNQEAPYIEQYRYKKRIESKLDDEHYWSEPAYENEEFRRFEVVVFITKSQLIFLIKVLMDDLVFYTRN